MVELIFKDNRRLKNVKDLVKLGVIKLKIASM